ncbi:MAG: hypothetical protein ACOYIR_04915 [Christensenellales bacterium]|jgi:hypothetical protein
MNAMHYIFALYVFLLVCGVIWFYARTVGRAKSKDKKGYEKEQRLFTLYQEIEDMLKAFEQYVEEAKAEIEARLNQSPDPWADVVKQAMSQSPGEDWEEPALPEEPEKKLLAAATVQEKPVEPPIAQPVQPVAPESWEVFPIHVGPEARKGEEPPQKTGRAAVRSTKRRGNKAPASIGARPAKEMVLEYAEKGMDQKEIARVLGISSREVALILELKKIAAPQN